MKQINSSFQYLNKKFDYSIEFFEDPFFPYFKKLNILLNDQHICLIDNLSMNDYLNSNFAKKFTNTELDNNVCKLFSKTCFITDILNFIDTHDLQYIQNIESELSSRYSFDTQWGFNLSNYISEQFFDLIPDGFPYTKSLSMYLHVESFDKLEYIEEYMFEYMFKIKHISSLFLEEHRKNTQSILNNFFQNISIEKFKGNLEKSNFSYFVSFKMTDIILQYFKKSKTRDLFEFEFFLKSGNKDIQNVLIKLNQYSPFTDAEIKSIFSILRSFNFLAEQQNFIDFLIKNKDFCFKIIDSSQLLAKLPDDILLELFIDDILSKKPKLSLSSLTRFLFNYHNNISIDFCKKLINYLDKPFESNPFLIILFKNNLYDLSKEELSKIFKKDIKTLTLLIDQNYKFYEEKLFKQNLQNF